MDELIVPPAPLWYRNLVVACATDNTLVYGSKNDLVVVREKEPHEPAEINIIHSAHSKYVVSVSLNKKWKDPNMYAVSLSEDSVLKVWNLENFEKKCSNKAHTEHKEPVIGAVFAGDDRIVSASSHGLIIVWNINTNESKPLKDLFNSKVTLTCLSSCPHAGWLLAFGLNNGGVVIADLRRNGTVLYKLRGHYNAVLSLSWCPVPVNVFPKNTRNRVKNKSVEVISKDDEIGQIDETAGISSNSSKPNPWVNLVHVDDGEIPPDNPDLITENVNFLKECEELKMRIISLENAYKNGAKATKSESDDNDKDIKELHIQDDKVKEIDDCSQDEKNQKPNDKYIEESKVSQICNDRPLPVLFDPSGDFFDDLLETNSLTENEILEDKDVGDEKNKERDTNKEMKYLPEHREENDADGELKSEEIKILEDKDVGDEKNIERDMTEETKYLPEHKEENKSDTELKDANSEDKIVLKIEKNDSVIEEIVEEEPRVEYLLASAGKDKSVYIWRAGTDGRMQTFFHLPKRSKGKDSKANVWTTICWITPDILLTSSALGEILAWPLPKPKESNKQYKIVHSEHSNIIFNMVAPPILVNPYNWHDKIDQFVWTWSQDGRLINYDLSNDKIRLCYSTVTASVTCFDLSSLDPNRLAIGMRDGSIKVWDLSLPHSRIIAMHKFHQKVTQKVSAIAWSLTKETVIGFGTEEGRVGFIDTKSKKTTLFPHYFHGQVYRVEWAPIQGDTTNLGLYVVAEGKVAIYDTQTPNEDPVLLELPGEIYVYRFSWKPDFSLLLLNGKDGSLLILNMDLVAITTVYLNEKGFNSIVWHPDALTSSERCNWFAATTSKGLLVYDCTSFEESVPTKENFMQNIVVTFEGHLKPTLSLAWSPFDGNWIISLGADGLAHVWDIISKSVIATFIDPYPSHNPAVVWSPINPDLVITGGDKLIKVWSISKNPPKVDDEFMVERKRLLAKSTKTEPEKAEKSKIKIDIPKTKTAPKNCIVPSLYVSNDENLAVQVADMKKLMMDKENETPTENLDKSDPLLIFGEKDDVSQLLTANYEQQRKDGKYKFCEMISLWKGNIGHYIEEAIKLGRVTQSIVTLAPMVSLKLYQEACEAYAKKLSENADSDPLEASTYYLACHKVEEAINCLCTGGMFKEALALAKLRLPNDNDIATKVTEKWAEGCITNGNFENAAFCYISLKQYTNAAKVLARRKNLEFLKFAAELAEKDGNKGLCDSILFKCNELIAEKSSNRDLTDEEKTLPSRIELVLDGINDDEKIEPEEKFENDNGEKNGELISNTSE